MSTDIRKRLEQFPREATIGQILDLLTDAQSSVENAEYTVRAPELRTADPPARLPALDSSGPKRKPEPQLQISIFR